MRFPSVHTAKTREARDGRSDLGDSTTATLATEDLDMSHQEPDSDIPANGAGFEYEGQRDAEPVELARVLTNRLVMRCSWPRMKPGQSIC